MNEKKEEEKKQKQKDEEDAQGIKEGYRIHWEAPLIKVLDKCKDLSFKNKWPDGSEEEGKKLFCRNLANELASMLPHARNLETARQLSKSKPSNDSELTIPKLIRKTLKTP